MSGKSSRGFQGDFEERIEGGEIPMQFEDESIPELKRLHLLAKPELQQAIIGIQQVIDTKNGERALFVLTHLLTAMKSHDHVEDILFAEIDSLITTIESQKEEYNRACEAIGFMEEGQKLLKDQIESLKAIINGLADERHDLINEVDALKDKLFDQKAITELAVKGLEYVLTFPFLESTADSRVIKRSCSDYLAKIERLTNAHIQPKSPS